MRPAWTGWMCEFARGVRALARLWDSDGLAAGALFLSLKLAIELASGAV